MNFKQFLLMEMAIKIASFEVSSRTIDIQIRTGNLDAPGGQGEHQPPHLHLLNRKTNLDMPIEISTGVPLTNHKNVKGKLSREEKKQLIWFLNYYGRKELAEIFNKAQHNQDPEPLFKQLAKIKDDKRKM